jgi:hypothetical protein
MSISRVVSADSFHSHFYTSLYKDEKSLFRDLQMFYKCFIFIKEVVKNYLTSFIIKRAHYLTMIKLDIINLRLFLISRINNYKYLISRI